MTREEAVDLIARGEYRYGAQRDMYVKDKRGREMPKEHALDVFRKWANALPDSTFLGYAERHAPAYLEG